MPNYEYDKDYPFAAFITNLGKYNEGELVGEWVKFPTTYEEMQDVFKHIGIGQPDEFGQLYEEWFITDYDCYVPNLYDQLGEYENLDELNYLASKLDDMKSWEYDQFCGAMEVGDHSGSLQEIINLTENLDCYDIYMGIETYDDLGRYYVEELDAMQVPDHLMNYIDYEAYGRDIAMDEGGEFTDLGYVRDTGASFEEVYDGNRENIPEEYRVMSRTEEQEISGLDKLDMALDLAFNLDEFFRQYDPQYAAENPEIHEAKEAICENLLDEKIAALEEKIAGIVKEHGIENILDDQISEFKDAIDYEESMDISEQAAEDSFSIYQLKNGDELHDLRFASLDELQRYGLSVKPENYKLVYTALLTERDDLESIYTRFNIDRPEDFKGHSLSVSDIVVLHRNGADTAHYCDSVGFAEVPYFLEQSPMVPNDHLTGEMVQTPRGSFHLTDLSMEQMQAAGYGIHHSSDDRKFHIMGNGTQAFAVRNPNMQEHDDPLRTAEMTVEDDYDMIDGVINNGRRDEVQSKPSIREQLEDAKKECTEHKPPEKDHSSRNVQDHGEL